MPSARSQQILFIGGGSLTSSGNQQAAVEAAAGFDRQVLGVDSIEAFHAKLGVPDHSRMIFESASRNDLGLRSEDGLLNGAAPILQNEAKKAGLASSFVLVSDVFVRNAERSAPSDPDVRVSARGERLLEAADLVAVSTTYLMNPRDIHDLCRVLKSHGKVVILGGARVNKMEDREVRVLPADYVLWGEAEGRLSPLLEKLGRAPSEVMDVPGIYVRKGDEMERGAPYVPLDFSEMDGFLASEEFLEGSAKTAVYESVRGCPFRCEFCDYPYLLGDSGKRARFRSAERILRDWQILESRGARRLMAWDSVFTFPPQRTKDLCRLLIDSGLAKRLSWSCFSRSTELAEPGFAELLLEAGCVGVFVGYESMNAQVLRNMNKRTTREDNFASMKNCERAGLPQFASFIIGFPGDTSESTRETQEAIAELQPSLVSMAIWTPDISDAKAAAVPIMKEDRIARFGIELREQPHRAKIQVGRYYVTQNVSKSWRHHGMDLAQAYRHLQEYLDLLDRLPSYDGYWKHQYTGLQHYSRVNLALGLDTMSFLRAYESLLDGYRTDGDAARARKGLAGLLKGAGRFEPAVVDRYFAD